MTFRRNVIHFKYGFDVKAFALCKKTKCMAAKPLQMHQIRRILELVIENYSTRKIAQLTSVARRTISEYRLLVEKTDIP